MPKFYTPKWVKKHWFDYDGMDDVPEKKYQDIATKIQALQASAPLASIVIPTWNEEENIVRTLSSLADLQPEIPIELLVVNNNSTDKTQEILDRCGVISIFEPRQGIPYARQSGLEAARGKYILCADADSLYPVKWADKLVDALREQGVVAVYSRHSFIPCEKASRFTLAIWESVGEIVYWLRSRKRPHLNAMGLSFGFVKTDADAVGGFDLNQRRGSDGKLAFYLSKRGQIKPVSDTDAVIWTHSRRLFEKGGLFTAFWIRVKKEGKRLKEYIAG